MLVISAKIHKFFVRRANSADPDQTASESDLGLHCLFSLLAGNQKFKNIYRTILYTRWSQNRILMHLILYATYNE